MVKSKNKTKMHMQVVWSPHSLTPTLLGEFSDKSSDISGISFIVYLLFLFYSSDITNHWNFLDLGL